MATFLFDKTIFGPVRSRRLGISLGINLLPNESKLCNFNCIYCECGWNPFGQGKDKLPEKDEVIKLLEKKLVEMSHSSMLPDTITFAGNGEPTLHPHFYAITQEVVHLRNKYCPKASIAVLSNATTLSRQGVIKALNLVDKNILKLDSGIEQTCILLNKPIGNFSLPLLVERLKSIREKLIIQTLFVRGKFEGEEIDNTTDDELEKWLSVMEEIQPAEIMVYTINRDTPASGLTKVPLNELKKIASLAKEKGFNVSVSD